MWSFDPPWVSLSASTNDLIQYSRLQGRMKKSNPDSLFSVWLNRALCYYKLKTQWPDRSRALLLLSLKTSEYSHHAVWVTVWVKDLLVLIYFCSLLWIMSVFWDSLLCYRCRRKKIWRSKVTHQSLAVWMKCSLHVSVYFFLVKPDEDLNQL